MCMGHRANTHIRWLATPSSPPRPSTPCLPKAAGETTSERVGGSCPFLKDGPFSKFDTFQVQPWTPRVHIGAVQWNRCRSME